MKILLASHNQHKASEIKDILKTLPIEIITLKDIDDQDEVEENGQSFADNALLKAQYYAKKYQLPVIADDSGLLVEALENLPGIFSARFAGMNATDVDNNNKLLSELNDIKNRNAHFVCCICYYHQNTSHFFTGKVHGTIAHDAKYHYGFGYDAVFILHDKRRFSDLLPEEKNKISHRYRALEKLFHYFIENPQLFT